MGESKSLRRTKKTTGVGSHAQKVRFKQGINQIIDKGVVKMAKDGTYRGGRRVRAGDKPDPSVQIKFSRKLGSGFKSENAINL